MQKIEIQAQPRTVVGRQVKTLRKTGLIPAVLYGNNFKSINIQVPVKDLKKVYAQAGESTLIYVNLDKESYPAIIHDFSIDPVDDHLIHADFYKVRLDEKIKAKVPVEIIGESAAVKGLGGILVTNINEIEVEGLPQDLPSKFEVDISKLENFGDNVQIKDLVFSEKLTIMAGSEDIIVLVQAPISEEELKAQLEAPAGGVEDVEVIKKEPKEGEEAVEEGAAPAEPAKEEKK